MRADRFEAVWFGMKTAVIMPHISLTTIKNTMRRRIFTSKAMLNLLVNFKETMFQHDEELETLIAQELFIIQKKSGYRYTEDAILLLNFVRKHYPATSTVLEMGTGGGIIALLLAQAWPNTQITAIELQVNLADMARRSILYNGLERRIDIQHSDLRDLQQPFAHKKYDLVLMNPPYFPTGSGQLPPDLTRRIAMHEVACCFVDTCRTAAAVLKNNGAYAFIHKRQRETELLATLNMHSFFRDHTEYIQDRILIGARYLKKTDPSG